MPRWRVDYIGKKGQHLGTLKAADERSGLSDRFRRKALTAGRHS
jgi:hypothetical protein